MDGVETLRPWVLSTGRSHPGASARQIDRRGFARLVEELSGAIEQVLDDYPEADVLLSGRMPRSVAYALGYVISQRKDDRIEGTRAVHHPTRADHTRAERAQALNENDGLSSLSRFWTSVTPCSCTSVRPNPRSCTPRSATRRRYHCSGDVPFTAPAAPANPFPPRRPGESARHPGDPLPRHVQR